MAATTIASTSRVWNKTSTTNWFVAKCAFVVSSALYVVTQDTGVSPKLRVHKSASAQPGAISFSEQDSANALTVTSGTQPFSAWATATHIHVVYFSAANTITHGRFSLSTDTWTTGHGTVTTDGWATDSIRVVVRSDNDVLVFFNSQADSADVKYSRWEGASWTEITLVATTDGGASGVVDAVMQSNDLACCFYYHANADDFEWTSISSTNGATTVDVDATIIGTDANRTGGNFAIYTVGGTDTITAAFLDSTSVIAERSVTLDGTAASTGKLGTQATVEATTTEVGQNTLVATAALSEVPYAVWWDEANSGTFYYAVKWGTFWGASQTWKSQTGGTITSATNMVVQAIAVSSVGILVVYQDGTDVKVDWLYTVPLERTVPASVVTSVVAARTVSTSLQVSTVNERTVPATLAVSVLSERTVPASLVLGVVNERTVSANLTVRAASERTVSATVAISSSLERTVPTLLAIETISERTVSAAAVISTTEERSVSANLALAMDDARAVPAALAVSDLFDRMVSASLLVATAEERLVPAIIEVSTSVEHERQVSASLAVATVEQRAISTTVGVQTEGVRPISASLVVSTDQDRPVIALLIVTVTEQRTIPASIVVQAPVERPVPASLHVETNDERTVLATVAVATTDERNVVAVVLVSVSQIVGNRFTTRRRATAIGTQARSIFATHMRPAFAARRDSREG